MLAKVTNIGVFSAFIRIEAVDIPYARFSALQ